VTTLRHRVRAAFALKRPSTTDDPDIERYRATRPTPHRDSICNAPRTNMYFQAKGRVAPCWKYFPWQSPTWSTERSILDIWQGPEFEKVRSALAEDRFIGRCADCEHDIRNGDEPLAAAYDNDHPIGEFPTMLELELSNLCNLECVMCNGLLSSRIRAHREHLPPLDIPYDETFVDQVAELLPHLHELRINGGEPMLQPLVHALGERVAETRPDLRITIATNGTVLNAKVRRLLEHCNVHLNISIDSLDARRYEEIRVRADFERLMTNFEYFHEYCRDGGRTLCVMVNPMRDNWQEMPEFVRWCNARDLPVWFNTILEPKELSLRTLPAPELAEIAATLAAETFDPPHSRMEHRNAGIYAQLVHLVTTWSTEAGAAPAPTPVELSPRR